MSFCEPGYDNSATGEVYSQGVFKLFPSPTPRPHKHTHISYEDRKRMPRDLPYLITRR